MSKAKIFPIDDDGKDGKNVKVREEMVEAPYESEEILQRLLVHVLA